MCIYCRQLTVSMCENLHETSQDGGFGRQQIPGSRDMHIFKYLSLMILHEMKSNHDNHYDISSYMYSYRIDFVADDKVNY